MKYYLVVVSGDVEPDVVAGPFYDEDGLDAAALKKREEIGPEDDGIYWLALDDDNNGLPVMGSWSGGFFAQANDKYWDKFRNSDIELE